MASLPPVVSTLTVEFSKRNRCCLVPPRRSNTVQQTPVTTLRSAVSDQTRRVHGLSTRVHPHPHRAGALPTPDAPTHQHSHAGARQRVLTRGQSTSRHQPATRERPPAHRPRRRYPRLANRSSAQATSIKPAAGG